MSDTNNRGRILFLGMTNLPNKLDVNVTYFRRPRCEMLFHSRISSHGM